MERSYKNGLKNRKCNIRISFILQKKLQLDYIWRNNKRNWRNNKKLSRIYQNNGRLSKTIKVLLYFSFISNYSPPRPPRINRPNSSSEKDLKLVAKRGMAPPVLTGGGGGKNILFFFIDISFFFSFFAVIFYCKKKKKKKKRKKKIYQ